MRVRVRVRVRVFVSACLFVFVCVYVEGAAAYVLAPSVLPILPPFTRIVLAVACRSLARLSAPLSLTLSRSMYLLA